MSSRRCQRVAEVIREVVSMAILSELKDPRVRDVTVTFVEVSGDLRHAKVHVSVMGEPAKEQLSLRGLQSAAGFLQAKCARRLETRYTPRIEFFLDQGVKKSIEVSRILAEVLPRPSAAEDEDEATEDVPEGDQPETSAEDPDRPPPAPPPASPPS